MRSPPDAARMPLDPVEKLRRPQRGRQVGLPQPVELMEVEGPQDPLLRMIPVDALAELDLAIDEFEAAAVPPSVARRR